jgi:hypothetical protein
MTRKRYKKLMMSIGYKRNVFNKIVTYEICGEMFSKRKYMIDGALFTSYNELWDWYSQYFYIYKEYGCTVKYDPKDRIWYGKIDDISDLVDFHTTKFINIDKVARDAIDNYLDFCARVGKEPERPNV